MRPESEPVTERIGEDYDAPDRGDSLDSGESQATDYPTEDAPIPELAEPEYSEALPVPVYDVSPDKEPEIIGWSSQRLTVTSDRPVELAGARRNRTRLLIFNEGTDTVYVGVNAQVSANFAYGMGATLGTTLELLHNSSVWAICAATETATVNVVEEYVIDTD